jgi:hypothetical protein
MTPEGRRRKYRENEMVNFCDDCHVVLSFETGVVKVLDSIFCKGCMRKHINRAANIKEEYDAVNWTPVMPVAHGRIETMTEQDKQFLRDCGIAL